MENNNYGTMSSNCGGRSITSEKLRVKYSPALGESYVASNLNKMYTGTAPTMRQVKDSLGDSAINAWLAGQLNYMWEFSDVNIDQNLMNSLIRLIRVKYHWLKITEFMHYVFLFRTGEFGKIYGKVNGQAIMLTLKDYCKMREDIIADIRRENDKKTATEEFDRPRAAVGSNVEAIISMMTSPKYQSLGAWRQEPWAPQMSRAFFVDHTLSIFPGDMSYRQRLEWARSHGIDPNFDEERQDEDLYTSIENNATERI